MSSLPWDFHVGLGKALTYMDQLCIEDMMQSSDATVLLTDQYGNSSYTLQHLHRYQSKSCSNFVWSAQNGISCVILGGSVKKSEVARHLWEVFSEEQNLDLSDLFPFDSPKAYKLDYTKETAQAMVL